MKAPAPDSQSNWVLSMNGEMLLSPGYGRQCNVTHVGRRHLKHWNVLELISIPSHLRLIQAVLSPLLWTTWAGATIPGALSIFIIKGFRCVGSFCFGKLFFE